MIPTPGQGKVLVSKSAQTDVGSWVNLRSTQYTFYWQRLMKLQLQNIQTGTERSNVTH